MAELIGPIRFRTSWRAAAGHDTFFVDDRGPAADVWTTINNVRAGDDATVFGIVPNTDMPDQNVFGAAGG